MMMLTENQDTAGFTGQCPVAIDREYAALLDLYARIARVPPACVTADAGAKTPRQRSSQLLGLSPAGCAVTAHREIAPAC
jgi:hypothetical protein